VISILKYFYNPEQDIESAKVELINKTAWTAFSDFTQSLWPFHFYWWANIVKKIHKLITKAHWILDIHTLVWYWEHKEEWIIVFKNWIWDTKNKMFIEKKEWERYYEWLDWKWYQIIDWQWNDLETILNRHIPVLNTENLLEEEDFIRIFKELYANEIWDYLLYIFFATAWYMLFWDKKSVFPIMFIKGLTWLGKTAANQLLQTMLWLDNSAVEFWNTSVFSITVLMSYLIKFPLFITEYREWASNKDPKVAIIRSVFDKTGQTKGKADQTLVKYDYYTMPFIEWEEMIYDWAVRTRSIQVWLVNDKHRIKWNYDLIFRRNKELLKSALFSYFIKSDWSKYEKYLEKWVEFFADISPEPRIRINMAYMYAWAMCIIPNKEKEIVEKLKWLCILQENDRLSNSTGMQIIKSIVYIRKKDFIVSWTSLEEYINRYRLNLSLKFDTYRDNYWLK